MKGTVPYLSIGLGGSGRVVMLAAARADWPALPHAGAMALDAPGLRQHLELSLEYEQAGAWVLWAWFTVLEPKQQHTTYTYIEGSVQAFFFPMT